ncbi:MAG: tripeptide aminopeptidase PepT, partial [Eubacteriales bacterium]|nr:tripeptide aminopeptidase PepT [Eubacteriales bacterium]
MRACERLMKYVTFSTGSCESNPECPSNPKEFDFAEALADEMKTLGLKDAEVDEHCYVMGTIQPSEGYENAPVLGLIAHMDTSPDAPNENVKPRATLYKGNGLVINEEENIRIPAEDLAGCEGKHIITSDGTTLLGADNKAGISEIMTLAEELRNHPEIRHGKIRIAFTPDEEIGRSSDLFDIEKFGADFAYTVDGDFFGECQSETFYAVSAEVTVLGIGCHPGSAKERMKDAIQIAEEFDRLLPSWDRPEYREGREGFFHLTDFHGMVEKA